MNTTTTTTKDPTTSSSSSTTFTKSKLISTTWMEDIELGRGYLLISDIHHHGIIWRFEIGGGPIPIGKSLFMNYSGCRSNLWLSCNHDNNNNEMGSSGITIQVTKDEDTFLTGQLIIVEKGEQRIIRLEKDGSRTPLVLNVTMPLYMTESDNNDDVHNGAHRIRNPRLVHYTPFGDLLFTEEYHHHHNHDDIKSMAGVYRLKEVLNVPSISFQLSKDAHAWTEDDLQKYWIEKKFISSSSTSPTMELLYSGDFEYISSIVVGKDLTSLYIAGRIFDDKHGNNKTRYVIVKMNMDEEDDNMKENDIEDYDDDSIDDNTGLKVKNNEQNNVPLKPHRTKGLLDDKATIFYDMTNLFEKSISCQSKAIDNEIGISLVVDEHGLIYATYPSGIAIISDVDGSLLGTLTLHNDSGHNGDNNNDHVCRSELESNVIPNSINIGKDQYMYVTTKEGLMRIKTKTKPLDHPTNLIVPSRKIRS